MTGETSRLTSKKSPPLTAIRTLELVKNCGVVNERASKRKHMHSLAVIGIALLLNEERGAKEGHFTKDLSVFSFDAGSRGKRRRK